MMTYINAPPAIIAAIHPSPLEHELFLLVSTPFILVVYPLLAQPVVRIEIAINIANNFFIGFSFLRL